MDQKEKSQDPAEAAQHVVRDVIDPIIVEIPPVAAQVIEAVPQVCCRCHKHLPLGMVTICGHLFCWPCLNSHPAAQFRFARGA